MALLPSPFDSTQVEPSTGQPDPVPPGKYAVQIVGSDVRATKAGTGVGANFEMEICEGAYSGQKIWAWINLQNQNRQAEEIGQRELSAVCHAAGVPMVTDTAELHGRLFTVDVKIEPDSRTGEPRNGIKKYMAYEPPAPAAAATAPPAPAPVTRPPAASPGGPPPWKQQATG